MPSFSITGFSSIARSLGDLESGIVTQTGALVVSGNDAVTSTNSVRLTVLGTISAEGLSSDLNAVSHNGSGFRLLVGSGGNISSDGTAVDVVSGLRAAVVNNGTILSSNTAIRMATFDTGATLELTNTGVVSGAFYGARLISGAETTYVTNTGTITGREAGITTASFSHPDSSLVLTNSGEIIGLNRFGIQGSDGVQKITNTGTISGGIELAGGDDLYIGRLGQVTGVVSGGDGKDTLIGGAESEAFDGGTKNDKLFGNGGDDTLVGASGNDALRGGADDDVLKGDDGRDTIKGGKGEDELRGGTGNDLLKGDFGDDSLFGGAGNDTLNGGAGNDALTGGAGSDVFVMRRSNADDVVTDFTNGVDRVDISALGLKRNDFDEIVVPALSNAGSATTLVDLDAIGGSGSILMIGLQFMDADISDFIF